MATLVLGGYDPISVEYAPRVLESGIPVDYQQRAPDGLNSVLQKWTVLADKKAGADIDTLYAFFQTHRGYQAFDWTPPGELAARRFICSEYTKNYDHYTAVMTLTAVLQEVPM